MEKDSNSSTNLGIFYLLIIFFVIMIFIPPIFRLIIPKEDNNPISSLKTLSCDLEESVMENNVILNIITLYDNDNISTIKFSYSTDAPQNIEIVKKNSTFLTEFDNLKYISGSVFEQNENTYYIKFDYTSNDFSNEYRLQKYSGNLDNQKLYYESKGFTCSIK